MNESPKERGAQMPKVSVIMPVYNVEQYVDQAINSILNQSFKNFEFIIINDGSTDHSLERIKKYQDDSRITVIDKENAGVSAARNDGIKMAKGIYLSFMDSDDEVEPNFLAKMVEHTKNIQVDMLMCGYYVEHLDEKEGMTKQVPVRMRAGTFTKEHPPDWEVDANSLAMLGYIWNKWYRRQVIIENHILFNEEMNFLEDIDFNAAAYKYAEDFLVLENCLYHYKRRRRTTLVSTFREEDFDMQLQSILKRKSILQEWGLETPQLEQVVAYLHVHAVKGFCVNLFLNENQLTFTQKCEYLNKVIERPLTQERVKLFIPQNIVDRILKLTIGKKMGYALAIISTFYSTQRKVLKMKF
ncbi:glycosyltransferase [Jeotgalibaca sp. MA1X17-3]|uniref:glycosyltransferase family 2 protein n=1 Tax=Jeotgalibaca sp. MA1X17-3 TaxID=2908211 RepID=UPI001F1E1501|nr:glycosyltransferase [Jeotgalibaca sp. MA1X17-3]UJF15399.1 glycosyltransferase [Jeotgalibaca sp. MA1X17-3]